MKLSVVGTGYLGVTHAAAMAALEHEVVGVDVDEGKVDSLRAGRVPFFEPGLPELLAEQVTAGRLHFTTSLAAAVEFGDVHFVCVWHPAEAR